MPTTNWTRIKNILTTGAKGGKSRVSVIVEGQARARLNPFTPKKCVELIKIQDEAQISFCKNS